MENNAIDIRDYGYVGDDTENAARVTAVYRDKYALVCSHGECFGTLKPGAYYNGSEPFPTTGDFVQIEYNAHGDSRIVRTMPRASRFARNDFSGHAVGYVKTVLTQLVAANFDYVFIMQSLNRDQNERRLERYLALAWESGATPVVVLTKADLADDIDARADCARRVAVGVPVFAVSVKTGYGLDDVRALVSPGRTIVFLGSSGVGKSSLVNALAGRELMTVNAIRDDDARGRHTTTRRQLIMLPNGAMVIDTPGMREIGMLDMRDGLNETFKDVTDILARGCRFSDCRHKSEPGCAVKQALDSGELSVERWNSYMNIKAEVQFSANRQVAAREKDAQNKNIAIIKRQMERAARAMRPHGK